jgi:hypothetical protein
MGGSRAVGSPVEPCPCRHPITITIREKPRAIVCIAQGGPPEHITLHADASPPGMGGISWEASDSRIVRVVGSGATANIRGLNPGTTIVTATYTCARCGETVTDSTEILAYRIVIEHPSGNPVDAPSATNEFTYSAANPGILRIECRARVEPNDAEARTQAQNRARWSIDAIGDSQLTWAPADPGDPTLGQGLTATATFRGLPRRHDDFGSKTVSLTVCGSQPVTTTIEVFWPKNATNHPPDGLTHPGGTAPNWFYYWQQVIGEGHMRHVRYGGAGPGTRFGNTPAMTSWAYGAALNKRRIALHDIASRRDGPIAGLHGPLTGIDLFRNTFLHERQHVRQIRRADTIAGIRPGTCWQNGWSFNRPNHNHWRLGVGRVPGAATGICPPGGPGTMGAAAGDTNLSATIASFPGYNNWPAAWPLPPNVPAGMTPMEQQAFQQETGREHALARWDWGDPGKNHRTRNRWND